MTGRVERLKALAMRAWSPALVAYAISGGVAAASFLSTMILARVSGPAVIGNYALAMSTATLLASLSMLGLDRILIREVAGDLRQGDSGRARGALWATMIAVTVASVLTALAYLAAVFFSPLLERIGGNHVAMLIVAASALIWPLQRIGYSALRAAGAPVLGQLFEALPTFLFMAGILLLFLIGSSPTAPQAVALSVGAQAVACVGAWAILGPRVRKWGVTDRSLMNRRFLAAGMPLMMGLFLQLFSEWLLLARLSATMGADETGAFRVAIQIITIIATVVATTEAYVAARLAGDFRAGRPDLAWARHRRATILMLAMTAPAFIILFGFPGPLLHLGFGPEFEMAAVPLLIMAAGQLVTVLRGPLGSMLTMAGHERMQLAFTLAGLAMVVALAMLLIPRYGLEGAAIAQAVPTAFRSIAGYVYARWKIPGQIVPAG